MATPAALSSGFCSFCPIDSGSTYGRFLHSLSRSWATRSLHLPGTQVVCPCEPHVFDYHDSALFPRHSFPPEQNDEFGCCPGLQCTITLSARFLWLSGFLHWSVIFAQGVWRWTASATALVFVGSTAVSHSGALVPVFPSSIERIARITRSGRGASR